MASLMLPRAPVFFLGSIGNERNSRFPGQVAQNDWIALFLYSKLSLKVLGVADVEFPGSRTLEDLHEVRHGRVKPGGPG